jgi:glycosyltransferase involved in cell wall biosynthesis
MHIDTRMRWMRKRVLYHLHTTPIPVDGGDRARVTGLLSYFKDRRSSLAIDAFSSATCLRWTVARRARVSEYWRPNIAAFVLESAEHLFIHESKWDLVEYLYAQAARRYYRRFRREILPTDSQIAVSRSYASFVQRLAAQQRYDYIWINFIEYARLGLTVLPTQTQRVIDIHDLASVAKHSKQDLPESRGLTFDFARNLAAEMKVLGRFDKVTVNSTEELDTIAHNVPTDKLHLIPHVVEPPGPSTALPGYASRAFRYHVLYVGSDQSWNVKAINTFLVGSLPDLIRTVPDFRVGIVGKVGRLVSVDPDLRSHVEILGRVPSLADSYLSTRMVICPLREGAGTKLKLSEAIYYRVPIVTTSIGASGLLLRDGVHCLVRDSEAEFTSGIVRLLHDPEAAHRMSEELGALHEGEYSRRVIYERLDDLFGIA